MCVCVCVLPTYISNLIFIIYLILCNISCKNCSTQMSLTRRGRNIVFDILLSQSIIYTKGKSLRKKKNERKLSRALIIRRKISRASSQPGSRRCADLRKNGAQGSSREQTAERDEKATEDLRGHETFRNRESCHTVKQTTS